MGVVGLCLGAVDLLAIAFTERRHQPEAVSWALAALSAGSAVGGLVHGTVSWRLPHRTRLPRLAAALGVLLALAGLAPGVTVFTVVVGCAGLFVSPAITSAYLLADESATAGRRTRAGAWANTAVNAGSSAGTATVGILVERLPLPLCFLLVATPALLCATLRGPGLSVPFFSSFRSFRRGGPLPRRR